jgi:uncharacterized phage protein gp47/JayE
MALIFPTPSEIASEYLTTLKNLKPEVDTDRQDSDWWVRSQVVGGVLSGVYADQRLIADDAFPQSARREALQKHLQLYFGRNFNPPQPAIGDLLVSGTIGTLIPSNTEFVYPANGNAYQTILDVTLDAATGVVTVLSVAEGQAQNLLAGAQLTASSPPSGLNAQAVALTNIADGKDEESNESAADEILDFIRLPPAGGKASDYARFAREADPSVVDANVIRYLNGLGTLGIVITAGTTDIDAAVDNGQPVVREPSSQLVDQVQAYVDGQKVETDCVTVFGAQPIPLDVEVKVRYASGNNATVIASLGLTQEELVQREVRRAIYKTPPGGRIFAASGFVVASEIEEVIDAGLSALPHTIGVYAQILVDRQVQDLSATGPNLYILSTQIAEPNTITVTEM